MSVPECGAKVHGDNPVRCEEGSCWGDGKKAMCSAFMGLGGLCGLVRLVRWAPCPFQLPQAKLKVNAGFQIFPQATSLVTLAAIGSCHLAPRRLCLLQPPAAGVADGVSACCCLFVLVVLFHNSPLLSITFPL